MSGTEWRHGAILLGLSFFMVGCAHVVKLKDYSATTTPIDGLSSKRVAVVVDPATNPDDFKTWSDGREYEFKNAITGLQDAFKHRLVSTTRELAIGRQALPDGYDLYLYPQLGVRSAGDFWVNGCLVNYRLIVKNAKGEVIANEQAQNNEPFAEGTDNETVCIHALSLIFDQVTDKALKAALKK